MSFESHISEGKNVAFAATQNKGAELVIATEDGSFYQYTPASATRMGPIALPGISTGFRVFEQLPGMLLLGFEAPPTQFGAPKNYGLSVVKYDGAPITLNNAHAGRIVDIEYT